MQCEKVNSRGYRLDTNLGYEPSDGKEASKYHKKIIDCIMKYGKPIPRTILCNEYKWSKNNLATIMHNITNTKPYIWEDKGMIGIMGTIE